MAAESTEGRGQSTTSRRRYALQTWRQLTRQLDADYTDLRGGGASSLIRGKSVAGDAAEERAERFSVHSRALGRAPLCRVEFLLAAKGLCHPKEIPTDHIMIVMHLLLSYGGGVA